ncbi:MULTISPECIES: hypothetical protein [unclassified Streptomyces]|uniref:hypothetical protein n=1 Tax=unclassified Streptomyces TaxID=2593676 RepID=UPI000B4FFDE5|nr:MULTISPECIES: hypothetical protein [unclassified Streptomyces]MYX02714.1 hypothetical protein [Streptomyces sp. SID8378]PVC97883.1 hypothetical protein DBP21_23720 [Streptomyces sp. CS147]SNB71829.1 hypothetical protein SAMN02745831_00864 [Streptomyces sp. PgraA7]
MTPKLFHRPPLSGDTERPVPRWATRLAHALPLLLLPACLWRLPFAVHFEMGQVQTGGMPAYWLSVPYVLGLSVLTEVIAILTVGLVRGWGEVAPAWIPLIGGRRVRPLAAFVPAVLGGLILTVLFTAVPLGDDRSLTLYGVVDNVGYSSDAWELLATVCVAPIAAWGPVTIALAIAYYRRRTARPANTAVCHGTSPTADPPGAQRRPRAEGVPRS